VRVDHARPETLDYQPPWAEKRLRDLAAARGASISINGPSNPTLMNGADPERAGRERSSRVPGQRVYLREVQRNALRFCVVAFPVEGWCAPVYPELDPAAATRQVAADLASFCRVADADPDDAWDRHVEMLLARADWLNELRLDRIILRAPGTDLEVGMARGGKWCAADETTVHGHRFRANIPTEEVFTSPDPRRTTGTFRCTRPLTLDGRRIDGIHGRFVSGRLVEVGADNDADRAYLASYVDRDRGAARLGELALVDATSRIGATGRTYGITLLDENAASHIAFGSGYASTRYPDGARVNDSQIHVDVMIGGPDMEVTGYTMAGRPVPVVRDGLLQLH
jgi:aminopeptidase